ncbi:MAG: nucleotidyl transferase AbiEii/AbiGii toxin family protein [Bacteroidales bacterium]|nr:nucleotidyl transferase AbiEii/AbiGii toxin family protein [Bacteroidales bacterium]
MIQVEQIRNFFPPLIRDNPAHQKYLVKEYIQLLILDYLATTSFIRKMAFIGGTNLRLIKGIDRFSEDLDFDCKDFTQEEFTEMTDAVLLYLQRFGLNVEARDKISDKLRASRRNIYFPGLLFDLNLSGYREERFLIKIECQDQHIEYTRQTVNIKGCGFFFSFPVPSDEVICAMKISALLSRSKGRDFYDSMFLLGQTTPDYNFLAARNGIHNLSELKSALTSLFAKINLSQKARDFEHLLFEKRNSERILRFKEFVAEL